MPRQTNENEVFQRAMYSRFGCHRVFSLPESALCIVCAECSGHSCVSGCCCAQISPDLLNQTALHGEINHSTENMKKKKYTNIYIPIISFLVSVWRRLLRLFRHVVSDISKPWSCDYDGRKRPGLSQRKWMSRLIFLTLTNL